LLLVNSQTATGTRVETVVEAVTHEANVHVVGRRGDDPRPLYEILAASDLDMIVQTIGARCTVYDLRRGQGTVIDLTLRSRESFSLSKGAIRNCTQFMNDALYRNIFAIARPEDDLSPAEVAPSDLTGSTVYELTRTSNDQRGGSVLRRWRVSLDGTTRLPVKVEIYQRDSLENPWELGDTVTFEYLSKEGALKALPQAE